MRPRPKELGLLLGLAMILGLGIILLGALELRQSYNEAARRGEEEARNLVHVLAEQSERTFQAVDFTLLGLRDALAAVPDRPDEDPRFRDELQHRFTALPYVQALFVIGPDGLVRYSTAPAFAPSGSGPKVSLADRPYFKAHQEDPSIGLHMERPLRSRRTNSWFVSYSRRINRPDGGFGGIVVAAIDTSYFEEFYQGISVGANGFVALLLRDGTLVARSPPLDDAIGKAFALAGPIRSGLSQNGQNVFWGTSPIDGRARLVACQALGTVPAIVMVGLARRSVLQPWREHALVVSVAAAILLGLIGALVFLALRSRRRERAEQARLSRVQRLEGLGRIAGGIAHDLGNTIRVMQSTLLLLKPSLARQPDALLLVDESDQALRGAKAMIERLLAFARRQELRPAVCIIDDRIAGFGAILKQAAGPRITLDLKLASKGCAARLDPVQLEATLLNLVLNARDAMPDGGTITVATDTLGPARKNRGLRDRSEPGERRVRITVTDTGVGMPPAVLERAFDPFFTTKGQGNGLGLSQVLGFVQQSAGEVQLESEEGRGTVVCLLFPALASTDHHADPAEPSWTAPAPEGGA